MSVPEGLVVVAVSSGIILSNTINVVVLSQMKHIPWAMRVFLLNLSASDLLVGVVACAPASYSAFTGNWPYGDVWCQISGISHGTSVTISIWSISMVGIDRYIAACHPHKYQHSLVTKRCGFIVAIMWVLAFVTFLAPLFTKKNLLYYVYNGELKMCGMHWEYPAYCVITGAYIPVLSGAILLFTTLRTNRVLKKRVTNEVKTARRETTEDKKNKSNSMRKSTMKQKAMKILALTSASYFTCWGPYTVIVMSQSFMDNKWPVPAWLSFTILWMANTNSMLNVFIYSATNYAFRQTAVGLGRSLCRLLPCAADRTEADLPLHQSLMGRSAANNVLLGNPSGSYM